MSDLQAYNKPPLTIEEQIELLIERGLSVPDKERAVHYLRYISYYRLSIYARFFQYSGSTEHQFRSGTSFDDILTLYTFDRELRLLVIDAIERIEVALRGTISYEFSIVAGANWYANSDLFKETSRFCHRCEIGLNGEKLKENRNNINSIPNPPRYESLVGNLKGYYSRRINIIHRMVYAVDIDKRVVHILRCWTHYE